MWRMLVVLSLLAVSLSTLAGCGGGGANYPGTQFPPDTRSQVTISQGIWGNVWFWEGDFMPRPESEPSHGTVTPVVREVFVYEPTGVMPWTGGGSDIAVNTKLVAKTASNSTGFFQTSVPPGKYSVFVKEGQRLIGSSDGLNIVTVVPGAVSKIQLDILHNASF